MEIEPSEQSRSSRPRLILHIGPRKTATTYLQNLLYANRGELRREGYLEYPEFGLIGLAHHGLALDLAGDAGSALAFLQKDRSEGGWNSVKDLVLNSSMPVLLSSELFATAAEGELQKLHTLLQGVEMWLVMGVRERPGWVLSLWQEYVKGGGTADLLTWAGNDGAIRESSPSKVLEPWLGAFPHASVHVFGVRNRASKREAVLHDFLTACGIAPDFAFVCPPDVRENRSFHLPTTLALLKVNQRVATSQAFSSVEMTYAEWLSRRMTAAMKLSDERVGGSDLDELLLSGVASTLDSSAELTWLKDRGAHVFDSAASALADTNQYSSTSPQSVGDERIDSRLSSDVVAVLVDVLIQETTNHAKLHIYARNLESGAIELRKRNDALRDRIAAASRALKGE